MKIGILDQTCAGWSGGASYTRAVLTSLAAASENGSSLASQSTTSPKEDNIVFLAREGKIDIPRQFGGTSFASVVKAYAAGGYADYGLDVVLPVRDNSVRDIPVAKVGWIPDFQHYRLPELFSLNDLATRDALFDILACDCELVIVSSESSRRDFETFLPLFIQKARVLPFPSTLWAAPLSDDPQRVTLSYHLPSKYAFVANQFWRHKNHSVLPSALSILKSQGVHVPLVLTGLPTDYRDAENRQVSEFFQACARLNVRDQIHFLGHLPYWDMISLMRCAAVVIQPSRFEGWNTSIEDAKALGRPLICSDIPVHREQAPNAVGLFETTSAEHLAHILGNCYPHLPAGPSPSDELGALSQSRAHAVEFGRSLLSIAKEALSMRTPNAIAPSVCLESQEDTASSHDLDKPAHPATTAPDKVSPPRTYLEQKRDHLRYIVGKLTFHFNYWRRNLGQLRHLVFRLISLVFRLISLAFRRIFHGCINLHEYELGILRQYPPTDVQLERFPARRIQRRRLPKISIVTPSYNQGHTLGATIQSVLEQNYPELEYAVVDGGSTDNTKQILTRFSSDLSYCVSEPDQGQAHAIVKGFQHLGGDIMAYLNSDDMLMRGALSFVGKYFAAHPDVDVIYGHRIIVDEGGREVGRWILPRHDANAIRHFDYVPQETLFWRRSIYEAVGGVNPAFQFAMDWDLLLRFISEGARFSRVPYFLAYFRVHANQKTHTLFDSVGEREKTRLLVREHPRGCDARSVQSMQDWYRFHSSVCAALLRVGIRY